jgi:hypothetical protein
MARPMPRSIPSLSPAFKARSGKIVRFSDASEGMTSLYRPSPLARFSKELREIWLIEPTSKIVSSPT